MENLFLTVLGMSATGSLVILAVLLARLALRKAPKVFSYALWAVALFRLLCPFTIESAFSLLPSVRMVDAAGRGGGTDQVLRVQTGIPALNSQVNEFLADHPYQEGQPAVIGGPPEENLAPVVNQLGPVPDWRTVPAAIWLAGFAVLMGYSLFSLLRLLRRLIGSVSLEGEKDVRLADHIPSPFVLGIIRPVVYLPSDLPESERDYILLHERTHIRRFDHVTRALAWLAAAVHWFNPLVWLAFHLAGRDMEMSCDEAVLRKMGREIRADYSTSLLRLSQGGKLPAGPLAFGGGDPQNRIKNILNYKKPAFWVLALALAGVCAVGAALATDRAPGLFIDPDTIVSYTGVNSSSYTSNPDRTMVSTDADRQKDLAASSKQRPLSKERGDELVRLVNAHRKSVYGKGGLTLSGIEHHLVRMDRADGGYYLLDYWYWNGFSFNPLHFGEDSYTTLVTEYDAQGNAGTTWQMEYDFDRAYKDWRDGLSSTNGTFQPGPGSVWVDYFTAPQDMSWEESVETQLPEYPGVTFRWTAGAVTAETGGGKTTLFQGMPVWSVFLCDLSGDGNRELCAQVSFGSGLIDDRVLAYDYAAQTLYELESRFEDKDYALRLEGEEIWVTQRDRNTRQILKDGRLVLTPDSITGKKPELGILMSNGEVLGGDGPICAVDFVNSENPNEPKTDLSYEIGQADGGLLVRMTGKVYGQTLKRNAVWWSSGMEALCGGHSGGLSMSYTFAGGGAELMAWWADEEHKTVALSTQMSALLSSYMPCGWWEFTVDLSGEQGRVTAMEAKGGESTLPNPVKMYPESITNQEAVFAARVAAKLLTAAEDFYNNYDGPIPAGPSESVPQPPGPASVPSPEPSPSAQPSSKPSAVPAPSPEPAPKPSATPVPSSEPAPTPEPSAAPTPPPEAMEGFMWHSWGFFRGNSMRWKIAPAPSNGSHIRCTYANEVGLPVVLLLCRKDTDTGTVPDIVSQLTVPAGETRSMVYDIPADGFGEYYLVMEEPREGRSIQGYLAVNQY